MTSLLEGARKRLTRSGDLGPRVAGLEAAVENARGRLDDALLDDAAGVVDRAAGRLKLSADHTVVALAGRRNRIGKIHVERLETDASDHIENDEDSSDE